MISTIVHLKSCNYMELFDLLNAQGNDLIAAIKNNISTSGQNATSETANSLSQEITQEGTKFKYQLTGRPFFMTIQTGRRPTPDKKPSRQMISNISRWVNALGIDASAVWGIATKINQEGTKLWQAGGRTDIVDPAADDFINKTTEAILENEAEEFKIKINEFKW